MSGSHDIKKRDDRRRSKTKATTKLKVIYLAIGILLLFLAFYIEIAIMDQYVCIPFLLLLFGGRELYFCCKSKARLIVVFKVIVRKFTEVCFAECTISTA